MLRIRLTYVANFALFLDEKPFLAPLLFTCFRNSRKTNKTEFLWLQVTSPLLYSLLLSSVLLLLRGVDVQLPQVTVVGTCLKFMGLIINKAGSGSLESYLPFVSSLHDCIMLLALFQPLTYVVSMNIAQVRWLRF